MRKPPSIKAKLLVPHRIDCSSIKCVENGDWDHPWFAERVEMRTRSGHARYMSAYQWLALRCNTVDCEAKAILSIDAAITDLSELMPQKRGRKAA